MAVHRWDFTYFMTKEEQTKLKITKPDPLVIPKSFDFAKAERVVITKEELKRREIEKEQKIKENA